MMTEREIRQHLDSLQADLGRERLMLGRQLLEQQDTGSTRARIKLLREQIDDAECRLLALPLIEQQRQCAAEAIRLNARRSDGAEHRTRYEQLLAAFPEAVARVRDEPARIDLAAELLLAARRCGSELRMQHVRDIIEGYRLDLDVVKKRMEMLGRVAA